LLLLLLPAGLRELTVMCTDSLTAAGLACLTQLKGLLLLFLLLLLHLPAALQQLTVMCADSLTAAGLACPTQLTSLLLLLLCCWCCT
jgi:hypothetical protein